MRLYRALSALPPNAVVFSETLSAHLTSLVQTLQRTAIASNCFRRRLLLFFYIPCNKHLEATSVYALRTATWPGTLNTYIAFRVRGFAILVLPSFSPFRSTLMHLACSIVSLPLFARFLFLLTWDFFFFVRQLRFAFFYAFRFLRAAYKQMCSNATPRGKRFAKRTSAKLKKKTPFAAYMRV